MNKKEKAAALKEWAGVMQQYPRFAKAMLAQQVMLIQMSQSGNRTLEWWMCKLIKLGFLVPFYEYWERRCKGPVMPIEPGGVLECLAKKKDPARCLSLPHEDEWFDDPLAGGWVMPPEPPIPPL